MGIFLIKSGLQDSFINILLRLVLISEYEALNARSLMISLEIFFFNPLFYNI